MANNDGPVEQVDPHAKKPWNVYFDPERSASGAYVVRDDVGVLATFEPLSKTPENWNVAKIAADLLASQVVDAEVVAEVSRLLKVYMSVHWRRTAPPASAKEPSDG